MTHLPADEKDPARKLAKLRRRESHMVKHRDELEDRLYIVRQEIAQLEQEVAA